MTALIMPKSLRRGAAAPVSRISRAVRRPASVAAPAATRGASTVRAAGASASVRRTDGGGASTGSGVHLTRRGRLFLIGLPFVTGAAALLVVAAVFLLPATVKASTDSVTEPVTRSVTVQSNQTLWEIAASADPQRDTREVMSDIAELNGLSSPSLTAGQVLEVPTR